MGCSRVASSQLFEITAKLYSIQSQLDFWSKGIVSGSKLLKGTLRFHGL